MSKWRTLLTGSAMLGFGFCALGATSQPASAETRSFVVSWFHTSAYSHDDDCPGGPLPTTDTLYRKVLASKGKSESEIEAMMQGFPGDTGEGNAWIAITSKRGNGKDNVYDYPMTVPDTFQKTVTAKYGYGFNLDGKIDPKASFEDPETHERGVDNQLYRAVGCIHAYRGLMPARPAHSSFQWDQIRTEMPAWLMTISSSGPLVDGTDVTVTFDRALEHVKRNSVGEVLADMTFRIDPDPRSHVVAKARIENGVLTASTPFEFSMIGDPYLYPKVDFHSAQMRLALKSDGGAEGYIGGYTPWLPIYWTLSGGSALFEAVYLDLPGTYNALRRLADAMPDPVTGQNTAISSAYRLELVPAFTVTPDLSTHETADNSQR